MKKIISLFLVVTLFFCISVNSFAVVTDKSVNGTSKTITSISFCPPQKTVYSIGDSIDTEGMKVTAYYNDMTCYDVTRYATIDGFNSSIAGQKVIVVSYGGFYSAYSIIVEEAVGTFSVTLGNVEGKKGDFVDIPLSINNNSGVVSVSVKLSYNINTISFDSIINGDLFSDDCISCYHYTDGNIGYINIVMSNAKDGKICIHDGLLCKIRAVICSEYFLLSNTLQIIEVSAVDDAISKISVSMKQGIINIYLRKYLLGDSDNDGCVTIMDVTLIQKYLAELVNTIDLYSSNCTHDGVLSILDATKIQLYLVGESTDNIGEYMYIYSEE